ncbi:hypothetical protein [uncultured Polaribacter sp.]|uniref:hypothetical protein n=1 Tax=uncultured Polaribacter sp. TaxID=174711 RepID=UPI002626DA80|nr:hypothetical protein [uncultured Polaribacter sp.]
MNLLKKVIFTLLITGFIVSCEDDNTNVLNENFTGTGLTEITFPNLAIDEEGDGTVVTVTPQGLGVDYYVVDFGDLDTTSDVIKITELAGSASYDYPNEFEEVTYTITVTAKSNKGFADVVKTENVTVTHTFESIDTAPSSPNRSFYNVFSIFTDGAKVDGSFVPYAIADAATGGKAVVLESGNSILEFSRLGAAAGVLALKDEVVIANAMYDGVAVKNIHFDVHSNFETGIDKLKITLVDNSNSVNYVMDAIDLTDGDWASFNYDLTTDFSAPVVQFDEIKFEVGTGGTANDHATINVDNVYMSKETGSTIINGDFNSKQDFWKWGVFTDGEKNPFGSSSDGSWTNYDGTDNGSKTAGAKWSSSQSGGPLKSSSSRYAYQPLVLTPNTDYILEYEYTLKSDSSNNEPIGGRRIVGLILDKHYTDGADAVSNISSNLGSHVGTIAEGKFSNKIGSEVGTLVKMPFTTNDSGEIAVMFYAVTPVDGWIDNVKVYK